MNISLHSSVIIVLIQPLMKLELLVDLFGAIVVLRNRQDRSFQRHCGPRSLLPSFVKVSSISVVAQQPSSFAIRIPNRSDEQQI
jgi:hypothetical protein